MLLVAQRRWFLLTLLTVLAVGMLWPEILAPLADKVPRSGLVAVVLFLMALPLEASLIRRTIGRPGPALLATGINLGIAPPIALVLSWLLPGELATGLIVAACVPCTLASATVWTRRAGGNDAAAMLVTLITNLVCFAVTPAWLHWLVGSQVDYDFGGLVLHLAIFVVVPIVLAQLFRLARPVAQTADRHRILLGVAAQVGILAMVFVGAVACGERLAADSAGGALSGKDIGLVIGLAAGLHIVLLGLGFGLSRLAGFDRKDQIAVGFAGSQKTLMVGLDIALKFGPLAILPMVAYHVIQLIIDTLVADQMNRRGSSGAVSDDLAEEALAG
jgi:sodium/bile acid cotransporter 7